MPEEPVDVGVAAPPAAEGVEAASVGFLSEHMGAAHTGARSRKRERGNMCNMLAEARDSSTRWSRGGQEVRMVSARRAGIYLGEVGPLCRLEPRRRLARDNLPFRGDSRKGKWN